MKLVITPIKEQYTRKIKRVKGNRPPVITPIKEQYTRMVDQNGELESV